MVNRHWAHVHDAPRWKSTDCGNCETVYEFSMNLSKKGVHHSLLVDYDGPHLVAVGPKEMMISRDIIEGHNNLDGGRIRRQPLK